MAEYLVLRLPAEPESPPSAARVGDAEAGYPVEVLDGLPAGLSEDTRVIGLVPAPMVLQARVRVPVRGAAKVLQTVPFALEEHLAEDIGEMHFAVGRREPDGSVPVAVAAKSDMENWREVLAAAGVRARALYAESALLHPPARTAVVLLEGDTATFAVPDQTPVVARMEDLPLLLDAIGSAPPEPAPDEPSPIAAAADLEADGASATEAAEDTPAAAPLAGVEEDPAAPPRVLTVYASGDDLARHGAVLEELESRVERLDRRELASGALPLLARQAAAEEQAVNLLQGAFAPASPLAAEWRRWRAAAVLLVAFLITLVGGKAAQLARLDAQDRELRAAVEQVLRETCPDVRAVVDARQQMRNCVGGLVAGPAEEEVFLSMLTALAGALGQSSDTAIEQISFLSGKMALKLKAPGVDTIERVKQRVAERGGLDLTIEQTRPRPEGMEFQIELSRKQGA